MPGKITKVALAFALILANLLFIHPANSDLLSRCLEFSGKNYAEAASKIVPLSSNFTVEMWVYPDSSNAGKFAEFISQGTQPFSFYMGLDPQGRLRLGDTWMSTGIKIQNETWTHIAFTHDANRNGRVFINGRLAGSNVSENAFNTLGTNTRFGSQYGPTPYEFFAGCLDEVRIWNSIRTANEINLNKDRWGNLAESPNLIASYSFDILTGYKSNQKTITPDESKNFSNGSQQFKLLTFTAGADNLVVQPRGNLVSKSGIDNCLPKNRSFELINSKNLPRIKSVNGRSDRQTSVDVLVNGLPANVCIGFDTFISGTTEPLTSSVAVFSNQTTSGSSNRYTMNIDTSPAVCSTGKSQIDVRGWWSDGVKSSQYGPSYRLPGCRGTVEMSETSLLTNLSYVSLVGEDGKQSPWRIQTEARLKFTNLVPAATRLSSISSVPIQDVEGCHSLLKVAILQKLQEGKWVDVKSFDRWVTSPFCGAPNLYQPVVEASLPDTTVLRWKVSDGTSWEFTSSPFIRTPGADGTKPSSNSSNVSNSQIKKLETPTGFTISLVGKEVIIRVFLPPASRSKVEEVNLVSPTLSYPSFKPLIGEIEGAYGVFRVPTSKLSGKSGKHTLKIDSRGTGVTTSRELVEVVDLSKFSETSNVTSPKSTLKPKAPTKTQKVNCYKGAIVRTFDGASCPPGYKLRK